MIKRSDGVWMVVVFALFVFIAVTIITASKEPLVPVAAAPVAAVDPDKAETDRLKALQSIYLPLARDKEIQRAAEQQQRVFDRCVNLAEGTIAECRRRADR